MGLHAWIQKSIKGAEKLKLKICVKSKFFHSTLYNQSKKKLSKRKNLN